VLRPAEIDAVRRFERRITIELPGAASLLLFHGSPDSSNHDVLAETPEAELTRLLDGDVAPVMAGGHTHIQMLRQHRGRWLINPGSVGLAFERFVGGAPPTVLSHAEFAIVRCQSAQTSVTLHRVALDAAELLGALRGWDNPLAPFLAKQYGSAA
jgi:hypothetical protein